MMSICRRYLTRDHSISMRFKVGFSSSNDGELVFLGLIKDSLSLAVNDQHNSLN